MLAGLRVAANDPARRPHRDSGPKGNALNDLIGAVAELAALLVLEDARATTVTHSLIDLHGSVDKLDFQGELDASEFRLEVKGHFHESRKRYYLELPSVTDQPMVILTHQQALALLKAAAQRRWLYVLILLGVATGARLGELLALQWADIDLEQGTVRIGRSRRIVNRRMQVKGPKTQAGYRKVVVGPTTIAALKRLRVEQVQQRLALRGDYYTDEHLVICKPDGRPYRPDSASTMFRTFADRHGLPKTVHVHTMRHSAASFLAAAGVPASDIAAQPGHADGGALALKVYIHPMAEGLARAGAHLDQVIGGPR